MTSLLHIETSRLLLRPLVVGDAPELLRLYHDPEVVRFMRTADVSVEEEAGNIQRHAQAYYEARGFGLLAGILKSSNLLVGRYGLLHSTIAGVEELEISYLTDSMHRGAGLATEAVRGLLSAAWRSGKERVVAVVLPENIASQKVAKAAGFLFERTVEYKQFGPVCLYARGPD